MTHRHNTLRRELGLLGAVMMGLGSIIGTGIFVSIALATEVAGASVILAIALAAVVASCNGLASAELAANHPVSGGTYEYGYRWLSPYLGFLAGWLFLCAKSASAATAALGCASYLSPLLGFKGTAVPIALAAVLCLTLLTITGIKRSSSVNIAIVSLSLIALLSFVFAGLQQALEKGRQHLWHDPRFSAAGILEASALMFVAYTGYGRIATLGEEVIDPRHTIPRAIIVTLAISMLLYVSVATVGIAAVGAAKFSVTGEVGTAPLEVVARQLEYPWTARIVATGAVTAMLGVLLNLILGLSRILLAMGRRGDMPGILAFVSQRSQVPTIACLVIGVVIAGMAAFGSIKTTWSFSAFTVLLYYSLTCLAALRLSDAERLFPRSVPAVGLIANLSLAFWVDWSVWLCGIAILGVGTGWWLGFRSLNRRGA
jgi:APA family basic amino acid/polyamine antiporter